MALPRKRHFRLCLAQAVGPSGACLHPGCLTFGLGPPGITPFPPHPHKGRSCLQDLLGGWEGLQKAPFSLRMVRLGRKAKVVIPGPCLR